MAETKQQQTPQQPTQEPQTAEERRVKEAADEQVNASLTPEQKHQNYLDHVRKLHSEP